VPATRAVGAAIALPIFLRSLESDDRTFLRGLDLLVSSESEPGLYGFLKNPFEPQRPRRRQCDIPRLHDRDYRIRAGRGISVAAKKCPSHPAARSYMCMCERPTGPQKHTERK
jgi:hypothetical protein